jgi:hypothetical protein
MHSLAKFGAILPLATPMHATHMTHACMQLGRQLAVTISAQRRHRSVLGAMRLNDSGPVHDFRLISLLSASRAAVQTAEPTTRTPQSVATNVG